MPEPARLGPTSPTPDETGAPSRSELSKTAIAGIAVLAALASATGASAEQARLWAEPSWCTLQPGETTCQTPVTLFWESEEIPVQTPVVQIHLEGALFACADANQPGQQVVDLPIDLGGVTAQLFPAIACDDLVGEVSLASLEVRAREKLTEPDDFLCPVDGQPLARSTPPSYLAASLKGAHEIEPPIVDAVSQRLPAAGIEASALQIAWPSVQPDDGSSFDWSQYDDRFATYAAQGIGLVVGLKHSPTWASSQPAGPCPEPLTGDECPQLYPPASLETWKSFVREVVRRYGPAGTDVLRAIKPWPESNIPINFQGTESDYVDLLNAAYTVVQEETAGALPVIGGTQALHQFNTWPPRGGTPPEPGDPDYAEEAFHWVEQTIADGSFDAIGVHFYYENVSDMVYWTEEIQAALVAAGHPPDFPIFVTEVNSSLSLRNAPLCSVYNAMTGGERADLLRDIYVCLANAGIAQAHWFKAAQGDVLCQGDPYQGCIDEDPPSCNPIQHGLLDRFGVPKLEYWVVRDLADYIGETLFLTKGGEGTGRVTSSPAGLDCGETCTASFPFGTTVTLTADADPGWAFAGWGGPGCPAGVSPSTAVVIDRNRYCTADFTSGFTLQVQKGGTGTGTITSQPAGIDCGASCEETYLEGTVVTLTATPDPGAVFGRWAGDCAGAGPCIVTMDADRQATAVFLGPLFEDGFETGDTTQWSSTVPAVP